MTHYDVPRHVILAYERAVRYNKIPANHKHSYLRMEHNFRRIMKTFESDIAFLKARGYKAEAEERIAYRERYNYNDLLAKLNSEDTTIEERKKIASIPILQPVYKELFPPKGLPEFKAAARNGGSPSAVETSVGSIIFTLGEIALVYFLLWVILNLF